MPAGRKSNKSSRAGSDGIGPLSPALRNLIVRLTQEQQELGERVAAALFAEIDDYAALQDDAIRADIRASCILNVQIWYQALLSGRAPPAATVARLHAHGRARAHTAISLPALQRAFRIGSRLMWDAVVDATGSDLALERELLHKASRYLIDYFDQVISRVTESYLAEQQRLQRWQERLGHDLVEAIFEHSQDEERFQTCASAFGVEPGAAYVGFALRLEIPPARSEAEDDTRADSAPYEHARQALRRALAAYRDPILSVLRHGNLLFWLPAHATACEDPEALQQLLRAVRSECAEVAAIGVGLPGLGAAGWQHSALAALHAIHHGLRLQPRQRCHRYLDIALEELAARDLLLARHCEHLMQRLAAEEGLYETLNAYFARRCHRKATAAALSIHPNTLTHRLSRIEKLLGLELDDTRTIALLHTAVQVYRRRTQR